MDYSVSIRPCVPACSLIPLPAFVFALFVNISATVCYFSAFHVIFLNLFLVHLCHSNQIAQTRDIC